MLRLADISGPFYDPAKPFRNWSSFPFTQIDRDEPPYVDRAQLAGGLARAEAQLRDLRAQGYNGIVIDNLAHLATFDAAPTPVYSPDSPFRLRALAYRAAFGRLFERAAALGMQVFVTSDMQWSTPPLRRAAGPLRADNPRLAELNRLALAELLDSMPQVAGLVVRVGEAGGAHNQGDAYSGHMLYTSPARLRELIAGLLPVCEARGRLLIVRTWSVGIGELGDLIWSPERYSETFGGLRSPQLLVSIKHGPADFFRLLPPNPTLGLPGPRQIVELQNRREYELFGMVPSSVESLHRAALARANADPQCAGFWAWNSTGGWGGGRAALGDGGWSLWTELSSALTAALAQDGGLDAEGFVRAWLAARWPAPAWAGALADLYLESAELIERGWYMGRLPRAAGPVGGVYLSPLLWVWWVRPTASLPIWAYLAEAVGDVAGAIGAGRAAARRAAEHAARLADLAPADDPAAAALVESARYLASALDVAAAARALMLPLMAAAGRGERPADAELRAAAGEARASLGRHRAAWAGRADLPPLELDEIDGLAAALQRGPGRVWLQARAASGALRHLRAARPGGPASRSLGRAGAVGVAVTLIVLARRQRLIGLAGLLSLLLLFAPLRRQILRAGLPWLSRRLHLLPSIFFETGPAIGEWAA